MKKSFFAVLAVAALYAPWAVQAEESYVKVGVGQGHYDVDLISSHETALSLAFGQTLSDNLGYEIGYFHFGKNSYAFGTAADGERGSINTQSLYAAAVGTVPLGESFSLFGKLGVAVNHSKGEFVENTSGPAAGAPISSTRTTVSETKTTPIIGVGAAYNFSKQVAVTAEYQYFGKVADGLKVDVWTVGLKYGF